MPSPQNELSREAATNEAPPPSFTCDRVQLTEGAELAGIDEIYQYQHGPASVLLTQFVDHQQAGVPQRTILRNRLMRIEPRSTRFAEVANLSQSQGTILIQPDAQYRVGMVLTLRDLSKAPNSSSSSFNLSGSLPLSTPWGPWQLSLLHSVEFPESQDQKHPLEADGLFDLVSLETWDIPKPPQESPEGVEIYMKGATGSLWTDRLHSAYMDGDFLGQPARFHRALQIYAEPTTLPLSAAAINRELTLVRQQVEQQPRYVRGRWRLARLLDWRGRAPDIDPREAEAQAATRESLELYRELVRQYPLHLLLRAELRALVGRPLQSPPAADAATEEPWLRELLSLGPFEPEECRSLAKRLAERHLPLFLDQCLGLLRHELLMTAQTPDQISAKRHELERQFAQTPLANQSAFQALLAEFDSLRAEREAKAK